jgi:hypothetical protein
LAENTTEIQMSQSRPTIFEVILKEICLTKQTKMAEI